MTQLGPTKTVRSDRHIQLSPELVEALREHRRRQAIERDTHGDWPAEWSGLVFPTATGRPVGDHTLRRDIKATGFARAIRAQVPVEQAPPPMMLPATSNCNAVTQWSLLLAALGAMHMLRSTRRRPA